MIIAMDKLCLIFARGFDIIEKEQLGASENHSLRVAALCAAMGRKLGYDDDTISAIVTCGMFHDSALTEYHLSQVQGEMQESNMLLHCEKGQENVSWLPFEVDIDKFVLYHHERGDGNGPFHLKEKDIPLQTALIAAADAVDATHHLQRYSEEELPLLRRIIASRVNMYATEAAIKVLLDVLDADLLEKIKDENIMHTLEQELPRWELQIGDPRIINLGEFIARVIDYKSEFTHMHTSQIANRSWIMADYYGYDSEVRNALFLAAALHDIGKIAIPTEILEKPGKLDDTEFTIIKNHVKTTLEWLSSIPDFEQITTWAADHHEKLPGGGYSRGKSADSLEFNARLMACIDIYQAVCEPRPYHGARTHEETMEVLYDMAAKGLIDASIASDMDKAMVQYSMKQVPSPLEAASEKLVPVSGVAEELPPNGYRCSVCGYFYEGEFLPHNFLCPNCRSEASYFLPEHRD